MEKLSLATIQRVTLPTFPWRAFLPMAGATDVVALGVSQKNIHAAIHLLDSALQLPAQAGQWFEVRFLFDLNQKVDIFGISFVGGN